MSRAAVTTVNQTKIKATAILARVAPGFTEQYHGGAIGHTLGHLRQGRTVPICLRSRFNVRKSIQAAGVGQGGRRVSRTVVHKRILSAGVA